MQMMLRAVAMSFLLAGAALGQVGMSPASSALTAESIGVSAPPPRTVTPPGSYDLSVSGDVDLGGFVFKDGFPFLHNDGGETYYNTAVGLDALVSLTPGVPETFSGSSNTAIGELALTHTTTGSSNTAIGSSALLSNVGGSFNTAVGSRALVTNIEGRGNTATGASALFNNEYGNYNTANGSLALFDNVDGTGNTALGQAALVFNTGSENTAVGRGALSRTITGARNIALGYRAGQDLEDFFSPAGVSSYSDNIFIGNPAQLQDERTIRLGTDGIHEKTHVAGVHNATLSGLNEHVVCVDEDDQLGACSESSARFKRNVSKMGPMSSSLLALRPVVFEYKPDAKRGPRPLEYGLIAEEVAEVFPHLVRYDDHGAPLTLRYDLLTPLLLNELQKQHRQNRVQWFLIAGMMLGGLVVVGRYRRRTPSSRAPSPTT